MLSFKLYVLSSTGDLHEQSLFAGVIDDDFEFARGFVCDPFFAALGADRGLDIAHDDHAAAEIGAESGRPGGFAPAAQWADVSGVVHGFFLVR